MGMKIDGDRLILPPASQLQEGFDLYHHRRSLRKIYQYEVKGEQFSLKVCKEQATNVDPCGFDRINVDEIPEKVFFIQLRRLRNTTPGNIKESLNGLGGG